MLKGFMQWLWPDVGRQSEALTLHLAIRLARRDGNCTCMQRTDPLDTREHLAQSGLWLAQGIWQGVIYPTSSFRPPTLPSNAGVIW